MKEHWKVRFSKQGVCDFQTNYDFFFKWLLNKVASCFYIRNLPETVDEWYTKTNLLLDGDICITDFDEKLYSCIGNRGGMPDEYYVPTHFIIANPILGSKEVEIGKNGVVIYNTMTDKFYPDTFVSGLYTLIHQTATLLADNIVSINANQINSRVQAFFTADSEAQASSAEVILKKLYAGQPYQVLRSDLVDKLGVNPIATANTSSNIAELVQLHNYIIGNFFQSIGIKSNNIRKNAHVLQAEIDSQDEYLQVSIMEILTSWQKGFDEVNALYGTDIQVELNPVLIKEIIDMTDSQASSGDSNEDGVGNGTLDEGYADADSADVSETSDGNVNNSNEPPDIDEAGDDNGDAIKTDAVEQETKEDVIEAIEEATETINEIVDLINDSANEEGDEEPNDVSEQGEEMG